MIAAEESRTITSMLAFLKRNWFPLALIGLFLFALPGVILCVLSVFGADAELNGWLEDRFQISYHLTLPAGIALVLLLLPLLIILLYFLKLKRKPLQVPSTFLWKKSIEDLHVNSLFQWLRDNILLVLQVLAVLIMIYSVLGLRFHGGKTHSRHYILLIDNSASMAASDVQPSRLAWAKQQALNEIDAAGSDDYGMVIVFNSKATTLQTYTNNKGKLREAVRSIEQTNRPTRIEEALALAESLANPVRSTEDVASQPENVAIEQERTLVPPKGISALVHLYSDGRFAQLTDASTAALAAKETGNTRLLGNLNLKYHRAGKKSTETVDNVGIVGLSAVRRPDPKAKAANQDVHKLQVLVRVRNFRPKEARVKLHLDVFEGGKIAHVDSMTLDLYERRVKRATEGTDDEDKEEAGEPMDLDAIANAPKDAPKETKYVKEAVFDLPALDMRKNVTVVAYLANHKDDFPTDDKAWVAVGTLRKAKVLVVGDDNPVLDAFFNQEATLRIARVERLPAKEVTADSYRKIAASGEVDLVVFDRCAPADEADLPQANTVFIDRPPPPWQRGSPLKNPIVGVGKHLLLRHLTTLYDISISEAFRFDVKANLDAKVRPQFELPEGDPKRRPLPPVTKLLEGGEGAPLVFTLPRGAYTDLVFAFPLVNDAGDLVTNWPLQPSFPLFLRNLLYHLGNVDDAVRTISVQPGEPVVLRPEAGVQTIEIIPPDGPRVKLPRGNRPDFVFAATDQLGVYRYKVLHDSRPAKEGEDKDEPKQDVRHFAVNLLDSVESNIEPRDKIRIGSDRIDAGQERLQPRDLWKWILLLAVVLLMVEWYIYNRRVAV